MGISLTCEQDVTKHSQNPHDRVISIRWRDCNLVNLIQKEFSGILPGVGIQSKKVYSPRSSFPHDCSLRLNRTYIIAYVNWTWTVSTGIVPFVALLLLNVAIFRGLRNVQRNLGRHKVGADLTILNIKTLHIAQLFLEMFVMERHIFVVGLLSSLMPLLLLLNKSNGLKEKSDPTATICLSSP